MNCEEYTAFAGLRPDGNGAVSFRGTKDLIKYSGNQRMIPGEKTEVFPAQCTLALITDGHAFFWKGRETFGKGVIGLQKEATVTALLGMNAVMFKGCEQEAIETLIGIGLLNFLDKPFGRGMIAGLPW